MKAAANLVSCMDTNCACGGTSLDPLAECYITTAPFGETETDFDDHAGEA